MLCRRILPFFIIFLFLSGCKKEEKFLPIKYNLGAEPSTLDPQIASDYSSNVLIMNLFEGLVRLEEGSRAGKGMAESWESQDDHKTFIFHLKKDAKWSDGQTAVTAKDFLYGIRRVVDSKTLSSTAKLIYIIKNARNINIGEKKIEDLGVEVLDDFTLKINLEYSFEDFPKICALPPMMPCSESFFSSTSGQYGRSSKTIMTNGPFKFGNSGWERDKPINLIKNKDYIWKNERAFTPMVTFSTKKDSKNKNYDADLFKSEDTDIAYINDSNTLEEIKKLGAKFTSFKDTSWGILFNCSSDIFSSENIRKGFLGSIERESLKSKLPKNKFILNDNIILDSMSINGKSYKELAKNDVYFDKLDNPKELFKQGLGEKKIESLKDIEIYCLDDDEMKIIGNAILGFFNKNLGYNFNIKYLSKNDLVKKIDSGDFRIALAPISCKSDSPLDFLRYFKSDHEENPAIFKDQEYDNLVVAAENSFGAEMVEKIKKCERYLSDHAVFYPVCSEFSNFAYNKKIENILIHPYQVGIDFSFAKKLK